MTVRTQLLLIMIHLLYGMLVYGLCKINYYLIKNEVGLLKVFITFLFVIDFSFLYLITIYKLTYGIFSYYYLICFAVGFLFAHIVKRRVNVTNIFQKLIDRYKKK